MREVHHADDAEHHRVADGDEAVDRAERDAVDELLDEDFHALRSRAADNPKLYQGLGERQRSREEVVHRDRRPASASLYCLHGQYHPRDVIRLAAFGLFFALFALWELLAPRRALTVGRIGRWPGNLGILLVDILTVRVLVPTAAVGASLYAAGNGIGLIHYLNLRLSAAALIGFLALDLAIYLQHVVFHKVPVLWRLHRMHHADLDIDVTTGVRFHPFEILISLADQDRGDPGVRHSGGCGHPVRGACSTSPRCSTIPTCRCRRGSTARCASSW